MNKVQNQVRTVAISEVAFLEEVRVELFRKSIHFLIALTPALAALNRPWVMAFLGLGTLVYANAEIFRLVGVRVPVISSMTYRAARPRDRGRFILGPVTLGLGAMFALLLYPGPIASIAIYALAFGDGFASLVGKLFGRIRPRQLMGKSLEGSAACFLAVFFFAYRVSSDLRLSFFAALTATLVEVLPLEDFDNIALPVTVGLVASLF